MQPVRALALSAIAFGLLSAATPLPPYSEALACAGVTQAASKLAPDDGKAFDAALYWSLATMDAAKAEGLKASQAEADMSARRDAYVTELNDHNPRTHALLGICTMRVPPT